MTTETLNETTLDACPTCGRLGCVGYCDRTDLYDADPSSPTPADWDAAAEYFASLPGAMPVPEDFPDVTPERAAEIVEACGGVAPF